MGAGRGFAIRRGILPGPLGRVRAGLNPLNPCRPRGALAGPEPATHPVSTNAAAPAQVSDLSEIQSLSRGSSGQAMRALS